MTEIILTNDGKINLEETVINNSHGCLCASECIFQNMLSWPGRKWELPFPVYSGFIADSSVTLSLRIFPMKSPTPFKPLVAYTLYALKRWC